ncbi:MAG TPA: C2 family cysteine protease [Tepidisphaeraceae bacterium]|nr:C2 family cysteine protease [Tepidisphaeraceae bacterium]
MGSRHSRGIDLVERLETRTLCAAVPLLVSQAPQADGTVQLQIVGMRQWNAITVTQTATGLTIGNTGGWSQTVAGDFSSILILAGAGRDLVSVDPSVSTDCIIHGGKNDTLLAGSGNDCIYGGPGRNVIVGGAGNDTIVTLAGKNDAVYGGSGFDNFWVGRSDRLANISQDETNAGAVHRIGGFMSYRLPGSRRLVKVPMTLNGQSFPEPLAENAVQYASTRSYPLFGPDGASSEDIHQQDLGDCYFLATLSSVADVDPGAMPQSIASLGDGTYVVEFFRNGVPVYVREDGNLPVDSTGTAVYGDLGPNNCTWVALMEKAYAYFRTGVADYGAIESGRPAEVYGALDFAYTDSTPLTPTSFVQTVLADQQTGRAAVFDTNSLPTDSQLIENHAYMVSMVTYDSAGAPQFLMLRNPWGDDDPNGNGGYVAITFDDAFASLANYCSAAV